MSAYVVYVLYCMYVCMYCIVCIVCIVGMIYISPIYTFITHSNSFSVLANTAEMLIMSNVTVTKIWGIECPKICSQV